MAGSAGELVGRSRELERLHDLVAELVQGRGRPVWVDGEPGIGKTALVTAALVEVGSHGCRRFRARADEVMRHFSVAADAGPATDCARCR